MMRSRRTLVACLVVVLTLGLVACSSDSDGDGGASGGGSGGGQGGSARVTRLDVPETTTCANVTYTTVEVRYATEGATSAELRVDGRGIPLEDPKSGTVSADIRCDPLPHDFVLFAYDAEGNYTTEKKNLEVK